MPTGPDSITVGAVRCTVLIDADTPVPAGVLFPELGPDEIRARTGAAPEDELPGVITALLVEMADRRVLVDAGLGSQRGGAVHAGLADRGIEPSEIDTVAISHGHADHVGGMLLANGDPAFPNARHVIHEAEALFWLDPAWEGVERGPFRLPVGVAAAARQVLPALRAAGLLDVIDRETGIAAGVRAIPAPGHTPGHLAIAVADGADELLWAADAFVHPSNVTHPSPASRMDTDRPLTVATRRDLLERAAQRRSILAATHFPQRGRVTRTAGGYHLAT